MISRQLPTIDEGDFRETIEEAVKAKRHLPYLKKVLTDFENYQNIFTQVFNTNNSTQNLFVFRFNYIHKHPVWRDIAILGKQTLCNLAEVVIESMGWDNDHMHGFSLKKLDEKPLYRYNDYSIYAPGWEDDPFPTFKSDKIIVANIDWQNNPKWNFVFDFGDSHEFDVELKRIITKLPNKYWVRNLPTCIDQRGIAPVQYPELDNEDLEEWDYESI